MGFLPDESKTLASGTTGLADNSVVYAAPVGFHKATSYSSASATTYTNDAVLGGLIVRTSAGSGITDTLPTAALILQHMNGAQVGSSVKFYVQNMSANAITLAVGAGITAANSADLTLAVKQSADYLLRFTNVSPGSEAATLYTLDVSTVGAP
jgi:hypothetical protein